VELSRLLINIFKLEDALQQQNDYGVILADREIPHGLKRLAFLMIKRW